MSTADVVVVGGGHNGLVCAAYLARAGLDVVVVEQANRPGGALVSTDWNGYRLERGAVEHTAILTSGVLDDLDLASHGLRYSLRRTAAVHLFGDGTRVIIEETAEATARSIEAVSPADAQAWIELATMSGPLHRAFAIAGDGWIPPSAVATQVARLAAGSRAGSFVELTRMSVVDLAMRWFVSPQVRALAIFRAAFSGLPPWSPGTAGVFMLTTGGHGRSIGRPVGGSPAVATALERAATAAGGIVRCSFRVAAVTPNGSSWVVRSTSGDTVTARRAVVSAIAPRPFLLDLLAAEVVSARHRRNLKGVQEVVGNVGQLTLAAAIADAGCLPSFDRSELDGGAIWMLADPSAATVAYTAAQLGQVPESPATLVTFPSVADPSAARPGGATMWANSFTSRHLHGRPWSDAATEATGSLWRTIESCVPGIRDHVAHEVLTTPDDLTALTGAENPGSHVAPTPSQTLGSRPALGFGNYHTPIEGIFLTGAGTHPGGGVSGASGRACAQAVLRSLGGRRPHRFGSALRHGVRIGKQAVGAVRAARNLDRYQAIRREDGDTHVH